MSTASLKFSMKVGYVLIHSFSLRGPEPLSVMPPFHAGIGKSTEGSWDLRKEFGDLPWVDPSTYGPWMNDKHSGCIQMAVMY